MKKLIGFLAASLVVVSVASAAYRDVTVTVTNNQAATLSDAVQIAGTIEKVEVYQTSPGTATVTIATYMDSTAIDTFVNLVDLSTASKLVRPVFLPTDNTGTALAGVVGSGSSALTNIVTTVLNVPYSKTLAGGTVKMSVAPKAGLTAASHTVRARIYFIAD
jgi:hypothetical protein